MASKVMMADCHFAQQELNDDLVSSITSLLDSIDVPNLLWSNYLLTVFRVRAVVNISI
jgi:hypothetical protein